MGGDQGRLADPAERDNRILPHSVRLKCVVAAGAAHGRLRDYHLGASLTSGLRVGRSRRDILFLLIAGPIISGQCDTTETDRNDLYPHDRADLVARTLHSIRPPGYGN